LLELIKGSIFILLSIGLLVFSWRSLERVYSHGFFRFLAFEAILSLILINIDYWFTDPFSLLQVVSWIFLCSSIAMAAHGFYLLKIFGKPRGDIENTSVLVEVGAYKYIRHPLYCSLLLLALGTFFKGISVISFIIIVVTIILIFITAKVEEHENVDGFGTEYSNYAKSTKMFIPFIF
jgi:protein-S-isoprenylcysteine O-methyltransferase Ste14